MPVGTPSSVKVTFVESLDCSSTVVSVAACPVQNRECQTTVRQEFTVLPSGQVGLCSAQVCLISLPGVSETYLPRTPPPNNSYSVSGAAALYHIS